MPVCDIITLYLIIGLGVRWAPGAPRRSASWPSRSSLSRGRRGLLFTITITITIDSFIITIICSFSFSNIIIIKIVIREPLVSLPGQAGKTRRFCFRLSTSLCVSCLIHTCVCIIYIYIYIYVYISMIYIYTYIMYM